MMTSVGTRRNEQTALIRNAFDEIEQRGRCRPKAGCLDSSRWPVPAGLARRGWLRAPKGLDDEQFGRPIQIPNLLSLTDDTLLHGTDCTAISAPRATDS